ncbi:MAG: hypothetical protein KAH01_04960 [Caldisericia bacterium]|nr:hypothetical protein [Caldisericia bacterium]
MAEYKITIPILNANDVSMTVEDIAIQKLNKIHKGDILFSVASSKAVEDVLAEKDGYIVHSLENGLVVSPTEHVASIFSTKEEATRNTNKFQKQPEKDVKPVKATRKAKELAIKYHIDLCSIDKTGIITEKDVQKIISES